MQFSDRHVTQGSRARNSGGSRSNRQFGETVCWSRRYRGLTGGSRSSALEVRGTNHERLTRLTHHSKRPSERQDKNCHVTEHTNGRRHTEIFSKVPLTNRQFFSHDTDIKNNRGIITTFCCFQASVVLTEPSNKPFSVAVQFANVHQQSKNHYSASAVLGCISAKGTHPMNVPILTKMTINQ